MSKGRSDRSMNGGVSTHSHSRPPPLALDRADSSVTQLCDLHVYKVPPDLWRESYNNILNNVVTETVSIGIIRVPTELRLVEVRDEIIQQLQVEDMGPRDYVFLRSVGRSLTRLRGKQEYQLKAKHFLPPVAYAPELYILEATPEIRDAIAISDRSSQSPPLSRRTSPSHRGYPNSYRNGYPGDPDQERTRPSNQSPANKYQPLPQIPHSPPRNHNRSPDPHNSNHYNSRDSPYNRNDPYDPYNKNYNNKDPNDYNNKHNRPPHEQFSEKPVSDWDDQPQTKQVVQAYRAAEHPTRDRTPSPVKNSPPRSAEKGRDRRHDDDSGVAGLSPEDDLNRRREEYDNMLRKTQDMQRRLDSERFNVDDETEAERVRRLDDVSRRNDLDKQRWDADQEERRRRAEEDRRREEEEKRKREENERREREEEERRRREEDEKRRRDEEERRRKEEEEEEKRRKQERLKEERQKEEKRLKEERERQEEEERQRNKRNEDLNRFNSPPARKSPDEHGERDTESARQSRRDEKNQLLKDIEDARRERQEQEKEREELVKKARQMQHKTTNRRNDARDMWKKKYFEEKKKTAPLEESSNRLQQELEALHRRLMNTLEGPKEKNNLKLIDSKPSPKNNYIIQCTKLQHEIEDLQRRVENARMKLTSEMKLRNQAQGELRALRAELQQRQSHQEANRHQFLATLSPRMKRNPVDKENHPPQTSQPAVTSQRANRSIDGF